jgi:hypothetical protein
MLISAPAWSQTAESRSATYNLFPLGSGRSLAMGGASTAIGSGASALTNNPAGLRFGESKVDLGINQNRLSNRELSGNGDPFSSIEDYSEPVDFIAGGLALKMGTWAIGVGASVPYQAKFETQSDVTGEIMIASANVGIAKSFGKRFSIGIGYHSEMYSSSYKDDINNLEAEEEVTGGYPRIGIAYHGGKGGMGISYYPEHDFEVPIEENTTLSNTWFRDAVVPAKTSFGFYHYLSKDFMIAIDYDRYAQVDDAVYPGSTNPITITQEITVLEKSHTILHGGFEWYVTKSKSTDVILRAGIYKEPKKYNMTENKSRRHMTYGIEVRFGPALLNVSFDTADDFRNTSQGFSVSFGHI